MSRKVHHQKNKIERILKFYHQEFEVLQAICAERKSNALRQNEKLAKLVSQLDEIKNSLPSNSNLITNRELLTQRMDSVEAKIQAAEVEVKEAVEAHLKSQADLRDQKNKIDSLEKLVAKKVNLIDSLEQKRDFLLADERYLSQIKIGSAK